MKRTLTVITALLFAPFIALHAADNPPAVKPIASAAITSAPGLSIPANVATPCMTA